MANRKQTTSTAATDATFQKKQTQPLANTKGKSQGPDHSQPPSKPNLIRSLLAQPGGATLDELVSATGWQLHSVRAGMTGLRKLGLSVTREKVDGTTRFAIEAQPGEVEA